MDSIRPLQNYDGNIVPQAVLNGTLGTVVYASNYNNLDNKPSINSVELRGNKTAEDLGLATPADITVTSVNTQTGDVSLTGQNIPYDSTYSLTEKINDLESQIVYSGVSSVNGKTGAVILTGTDINYSAGVSLNAKIDAVEGEIPVVDYPVTSVNNKTGAVNLTGSDIEYSAGVSINTQIENVAGDLADLTAEDIPMSGTDSTPTATAIGDLSDLTTSVKSSLVKAVNEVVRYTPVYGNEASGAIATFDTSLALPLQDCTIGISGSGATGANIVNHGKNYLDTSTNVNGKALSATGVETSVPAACYTDLIKVVGGEKYTFGATSAIVDAWNRRIHGYDESGNWVQEIMNSNSQSYAVGTPFTMTFTVPSGISYVRISYYKDTNAQLEKGEIASAYQAYNSTTTAITWQSEAGTVSEGSLNVTTGKLTVVNGSMGAGEYQITPIPINQLSGTNNVFTDTNGDTSVVYACSLKDYIDSQ